MEDERKMPSLMLYGDRGTGGKIRRPSTRKFSGTPYSRPPPPSIQSAVQPRHGGWFSKLVDPAYRLIAGGASVILPSFFSKSNSTDACTVPDTNDNDKGDTLVVPEASQGKFVSDFELKQSDEGAHSAEQVDGLRKFNKLGKDEMEAGPSNMIDEVKNSYKFNELEHDERNDQRNDSDFSHIEHMIEGRKFSRDEVDHLLEILNNRVSDLSHVEREVKKPSMTLRRGSELINHEKLKKPIREEQDDMNGPKAGNSAPLLPSNNQMEVGASPIDIARAYMESRTSEVERSCYGVVSRKEPALKWSDEYERKPPTDLTSPMPTTFWPGAILPDKSASITPFKEKGKYGLHNFPRTPYSRSTLSMSKSKLSQLHIDSSQRDTPWSSVKKPSTPFCSQVKSRKNVLDGSYGSVEPIRRVRHKFTSEVRPRESIFRVSSQHISSPFEKSSVSRGILSTTAKNLESGGTSGCSKEQLFDHLQRSDLESHPLNPSPAEAVRKILEHLDRKVPTPKEKADELKLATAWRKHRPDFDGALKEIGPSHSKQLDSENKDIAVQKTHSLRNNDIFTNSKVEVKGRIATDATTNGGVDSGKATANDSTASGAGKVFDTNAGISSTFNNVFDSQTKNMHEKAFVGTESTKGETSQKWPHNNVVNGHDPVAANTNPNDFDASKQLLSHYSGSKPFLTSISINKPDLSRAFSPENGGGFTFPVSTTSGVFSDPPTPSIFPCLPGSGVSKPQEVPEVPSYTFGSKSPNTRLVFVFPSTSNTGPLHDASEPKFNFGSDRKNRLSFSSIGKDTICC